MSYKQHIYRQLIHHGFVEMRVRESHAAFGPIWWLLRHRRHFCGYGVAVANLLHRLHETILEPHFTDVDLSFLNQAVPRFFQQAGADVHADLITMLVDLHDVVPEELRCKLTWHPSESHRQTAQERLR